MQKLPYSVFLSHEQKMSCQSEHLRSMNTIKELENAIHLMRTIVRRHNSRNAFFLCWSLSLTESTRDEYRKRLSEQCAQWFETTKPKVEQG